MLNLLILLCAGLLDFSSPNIHFASQKNSFPLYVDAAYSLNVYEINSFLSTDYRFVVKKLIEYFKWIKAVERVRPKSNHPPNN